MNRFAPVLRRISRELDLPAPIRSRVILEMASDLEALYAHYRERGLSEEEAARRAEEKVLASPEALHQLVTVHSTGYAALFARVAGRLQHGLALLLLLAGALPLVALGLVALVPQILAARTSPFVWTLALAGAAIAALTLLKLYQLMLRKEEDIERRHRGLFFLFFLALFTPALGLLGYLSSVYALAQRLARGTPPEQVVVAEWIARESALFGVSILLGIGAGLAWFLFARRVAALERAESAHLLAADS